MTEKKQKYPKGTAMIHKTLGRGVVQETNYSLHKGLDDTYAFFKPDIRKPKHMEVLLVDVEALEFDHANKETS